MSLPDCLVQEFRNVLALHCREICMFEKAGGEKTEKQMDHCFQSFHGTESHQSVVDLFLSGKGHYEEAFEKVDIEINRAGSEARNRDGCMLELKELFHSDPTARCCVHDPGFTRQGIAYQIDKPSGGRILYDKSLQVIANYKHALKHYKAHSKSKEDDPSGMKFPDMVEYVGRKMFVEFKGGRNKPTGSTGRNKVTPNEEDMPVKCMFNGLFSFMLFCPSGLAKVNLATLSEDGKGVPKKSRNDMRMEQAKKDEAERAAGTGGYVPEAYRHGVNLSTKASVAHIAISEHAAHAKLLRELMSGLLQDSKQTLEEHKIVCEQLEENCGNPDEAKLILPWKNDLAKVLQSIRKRRAEEEVELREHLKKKPKQMEALCDQVGDFASTTSATTGTTASLLSPRGRLVGGKHSDETSVLTSDKGGSAYKVITLDEDGDAEEENQEEEAGHKANHDSDDEDSATSSQFSRESERQRYRDRKATTQN